jgi:hypothetical protein
MDDLTGGGTVQSVGLGLAGIGGIIWAIYEKIMRAKLENANSDSNIAVANANEVLFNMLTNRLDSLDAQVKQLTMDLAREREYTRLLVGAMMQAGIPIPAHPA